MVGVFDVGNGGLGHYFVILSFCHFVILGFCYFVILWVLGFWGFGVLARRYPDGVISPAFFISIGS